MSIHCKTNQVISSHKCLLGKFVLNYLKLLLSLLLIDTVQDEYSREMLYLAEFLHIELLDNRHYHRKYKNKILDKILLFE